MKVSFPLPLETTWWGTPLWIVIFSLFQDGRPSCDPSDPSDPSFSWPPSPKNYIHFPFGKYTVFNWKTICLGIELININHYPREYSNYNHKP